MIYRLKDILSIVHIEREQRMNRASLHKLALILHSNASESTLFINEAIQDH